jgi:(p)ppGpp synthase/HD superfamily hydrolase
MSEENGSGPEIDLAEVDAFADAAHRGQQRTSGVPYITHPRGVRRILEDEFPEPVDDTMLAIALLHDVLEDCDVHPTILLERYGVEVQEGVTLLSVRILALGIERGADVYWAGIRNGPRAVRLVKAADRLHNMREALSDGHARFQRKYLDETPRELIPVLEDAGETWFAERLRAVTNELERALG